MGPTRQRTLAFYVSPSGRDQWSGTLPSPDSRRRDGPFASLERALKAVEDIKNQNKGRLPAPVTIRLRKGTYYLDKPVRIGPEHSGEPDRPVTIESYQQEKVVLSGGRPIGGWKEVVKREDDPSDRKPVPGTRLWRVVLPEVRSGDWYFRQVWIDGRRGQRARHPNKGYFKVKGSKNDSDGGNWYQGQFEFFVHPEDLPGGESLENGEVVAMNRWVESRLPIRSVDRQRGLLSFQLRTVFRMDPGDYYYIENVPSALDQPGEWYLDGKGGVLFYLAPKNWDPDRSTFIAPALSQLIRLEGDPEKGSFVEHVRIKGLTFSHTEWFFPGEKDGRSLSTDTGGFPQAAYGVPGAVDGNGLRNCIFENCQFVSLGTYGLSLGRGCKGNQIRHCTFSDLGAGGIKIGETTIREKESDRTEGNEVSDCDIGDGGRFFHSAVGIWIGQSGNNRIAHNHIHNFYYTGISIGWTWGYDASLAGGNIVEYNHVHHIGIREDGDGPILSDMGGIYTLGLQHGTVIRHNLWHDIAGYRYGGWGIYFDEGSSGIVAENNLVYRTTHGGFHQHYGRENLVRNNIFAFARDHQMQASRPEPHIRFRFIYNIVYWDQGELMAGNFGDRNFEFDRNIYWKVGGGPFTFAGLSWDEWRASGMDKNSLIADPRFVDPKHADFRLSNDSPALSVGFRPFDLSGVGPRKRQRN